MRVLCPTNMYTIPVIAFNILLICIVASVAADEEYQNARKCIIGSAHIRNNYQNLIKCQNNYIQHNIIYDNGTTDSCKNLTDVNNAYTILKQSYYECFNVTSAYREFYNKSIGIYSDYFNHALSEEKIKEFYNNDGKRCTTAMRSDILQCVNATLKIKKPFIKNITNSLIKINRLLYFNKRSCDNSVSIQKCIDGIPENDCNVTKHYMTYLQNYIMKKYCTKNIVKPKASTYSGTGVTIGVLFAVIAILGIAFVLYKRRHTIFRKRGTPKEGQVACSYNVAKETVTT